MEKTSAERYRTYLAQIYRFEASIEAACVATDGLDRGILRSHLKTGRLALDLEALGLPIHHAVPLDPPHFADPAEALSWLWVVHRNTLLHGLVSRYLKGKLPGTIEIAGTYLSAFEGRAGALMRDLGDAFENVTRRASIAERIVASANDAFRAQRQWYSCNVLSPERPGMPRTSAPKRVA